ncbi:MAG: DUF4105 domain-containing protein [Bdellovibrionales bacterium]|nr:DUF4105 domain-containing protein [Bdellovibrionales bacterium]
MKIFGIFLFLPIVGLFNSHALSASTEKIEIVLSKADIQQLINAAEVNGLERSRQWQKLLHIERNLVGVKSSQVVDSGFFLAQGLFKNQSELSATVYSFFIKPEVYAQQIDPPIHKSQYKVGEKLLDHSQHPICRFPARLKFLRQNLGSQSAIWKQLPRVNCTYQYIFLQALDAAKVNFVFSSYYSDSPGSAFGHTFFRVQRKSNLAVQHELLDYGLSYAANVTTSNGFLYAFLGLVGGFTGSWTNMPYYYKVREYNDFEARDLWSYELNLTQDEVNMLSLHMWEVGSHTYRYFFFTQNCAFHMLTVLEAAAPRLHLSDKVPFNYVIPSDSLKALFYEPDLIKKVQFRPSLRKIFLARLDRLNDSEKNDLKKYILNTKDFSVLEDQHNDRSAHKIDAALDYLDLKYSKQIMDTKSSEFKIKEELLNKRAQVNFVTPELKFKTEDEEDPAKSHGSSRWSLLGTEKRNQYYFGYRFALHDLLDPSYGLPKNSQLEFFNFLFFVNDNKYYLNKFNLFRVFNLNPLNFYDRKFSWGVEIGADRQNKNCRNEIEGCLLYGTKMKAGVSVGFSTGDIKHYLWGLGVAEARYSSQMEKGYYLWSPGAEIGLLTRFSEDFSLMASYSKEFPINMNKFETYEVKLRKSFANKWALAAEYENDIKSLGFYYYF